MNIIDVRLRRSARGVPHIVVETDQDTYSLQYFASTGKYKVWAGYGDGDNVKIFSKEFNAGETLSLSEIIRNPNR